VSFIHAHARSSAWEEVCGFLAGRHGVITHAFRAVNAATSRATSYDVSPKEIIEKMREIRESNLEFLGIYHSHPNSPNEPSPTDIELAAYPDAAYFILSPLAGVPNSVRAFHIQDGVAQELRIEVIE
jgi:[CysO sulfur-carrier protein]-S-L-cysteine hydrolase